MKHDWPLTLLGEILTERREVPSSKDLESERVRIIGKIAFDTGKIEFRSSANTKTGMILIYPGDFVVSGINAAKGAIAVYDELAEEPVAATIHYSAYVPDRNRVDIMFLWWMLRSQFFRELLSEFLPGGIKTELRASRLLRVPIPLPTLAEQQRLLIKLQALYERLGEASALRINASENARAIIKSALRHLAQRVEPLGTLGDVLQTAPRNGWSARCDNAGDGIPVLSLKAITGFHYRSTEFKRTSLHAPKDGHFWLRPGDLLISRSNTPELVGHAAIYNGFPSPCIYPDLMMRIEVKHEKVDKRFVWYWLQSPLTREHITKYCKGTSPTMKKISQKTVMMIPFPSKLSLLKQKQAVAELDALQAEVGKLDRLQHETAADLQALFPSILDHAFKGDL